MYAGNNNIGTESLETIINCYLAKRGPYTMTELKFINVNIYDTECF